MGLNRVSVIVVSYNTRDKLRKCLQAIEPEHELIVVDNMSTDGSPEMVEEEFPRAKLIRNPENRGFGAANNQGAAIASGQLLLYLNSDAYAVEGAIERLAQPFADPSIAAAGGRLLNLDGSLQESTANRLTLWAVFCEQFYLEKIFPGSSMLSPYWNTRKIIGYACPADTEQVMGACLMTRASLEQFDERYFLYCEDTDLCYRLRQHGRIVYVKDASFTHELGSSSSADPVKAVIRYNQGKELYFKIRRGEMASIICMLLDRAGALMRCFYWCLRALTSPYSNSRTLAQGFWKAVWAPSIGPMSSFSDTRSSPVPDRPPSE